MQLPVSASSSETLFLVFAEKEFPLLPNVYPKPWDVHTKVWNICTKSWDIHPKLWDINRTTQKKEFSRYFERVYAQWAKCSTNKTVSACVFPKFHTHILPAILTPLFDTKINQDINKRFYDESKLQSKANCGCGKADATDDGNDCTETSHKGVYPNQGDAERMGQAQPALHSA